MLTAHSPVAMRSRPAARSAIAATTLSGNRRPTPVTSHTGTAEQYATDIAARANPDGLTLNIGNSGTHAINPSLYKNAGYDPIKQFDAIIQSAWTVTLLGISMVGTENINTVKEFVALVKSQPGKFNYTSSGVGTPQHLRMAILNQMTGMDLTHVPFKTPAEMTRAMLVGDVLAMFNSGTVLIPQARAKKIKLLAYIGNERWPETPDVPTMSEAGFPEFKADIWHGFLAPAGTPRDVIRRINSEMAAILTAPGPKDALIKHGVAPVTSTPEQFAETIRNDFLYWAKAVKSMGLELQ